MTCAHCHRIDCDHPDAVFQGIVRAAPAVWPYPHRNMAEVMADKTIEQPSGSHLAVPAHTTLSGGARMTGAEAQVSAPLSFDDQPPVHVAKANS